MQIKLLCFQVQKVWGIINHNVEIGIKDYELLSWYNKIIESRTLLPKHKKIIKNVQIGTIEVVYLKADVKFFYCNWAPFLCWSAEYWKTLFPFVQN